ncbi:MAG: 3-hydroxyacyl-[acyl-carrier-protein] dehydratase, FabZ form [Pseudolabrys sp.]|jgi:3-hydroxyacyl-[acyl-carrier-protein] dehydratase|nr:3-hydroxyacyl-[acyl-carrier-protein] dehydratase, FabZ form [Pseudolabrys sp.]
MRIEKFQLIDRVVEFKREDRTIRCEATVPQESSIFEGHFPGYPLMPGVLLVEAMAQTSGWMIIGREDFKRMAFLVSVRDAKFRSFVPPGSKLIVSAKISHDGSGFAVTQAQGELGDRIVCDATLTFRVTDFPNDELRNAMLHFATIVEFPMELVAND